MTTPTDFSTQELTTLQGILSTLKTLLIVLEVASVSVVALMLLKVFI